jgi:hypothetical protein
MPFKGIIAAYSENHNKHIITMCGQNGEFSLMLKQIVHIIKGKVAPVLN